MKYLIFIFCLSLFAVIRCGQTDKKIESREVVIKESLDTLTIVQNANRYRLKLDSLKPSLDSLSKDIYESTEGGTLKVFFKASDTLKKEIVYYGETGKRVLEIYLKEGNPIIIEDISIKYQEPIYSSTDVSVESKVNNIYYLNSESHLIYWIKEDQVMPPSLYLKQAKEIIKK